MNVDAKGTDVAANAGEERDAKLDPAAELKRRRSEAEARAWEQYRAADQKLYEAFADALASVDEAAETCNRIVHDLHLGAPRKPDEPWNPDSTAAGMKTVASLASNHIVDTQSATHLAVLHLRSMAIMSQADDWSNLLWARAHQEGKPAWLAHAFKPVFESVRCMRAHADVIDKLDRRKLRRGKIAAQTAALTSEKRAEERTAAEVVLAEAIRKAA